MNVIKTLSWLRSQFCNSLHCWHKPWIAVALPFIWIGCAFQFDENYVDVDPTPKAAIVSSEINSAYLMDMPDTFAIYARVTELEFSLELENVDTITVYVSIDNSWGRRYAAGFGSFTINTDIYKDGYHTILMEIKTNSGTGSLADKTGGETLVKKLQWTFLVARKSPELKKIVKTYIEDGRLAIEWEPSNEPTEKLLEFLLSRPDASSVVWSTNVKNPNTTKILEPLFFGGNLRISLTNLSIDPAFPSPKHSITVDYPYPKIVAYSAASNGNITLEWTKSLFYKNVSKYLLFHNGVQLLEKTNVDDTIGVSDKIPFGYGETVTLTTVAKSLKNYLGQPVYLNSPSLVYVGKYISTGMDQFIHAPLKPELGFNYNYTSKKLEVLVLDSAVLSIPSPAGTTYHISRMAISENGEYLYLSNGPQLLRMDRTGNIATIFDTQVDLGSGISMYNISVSQGQYLSFTSTGLKKSIYMCDLINRKLVAQRDNIYGLRKIFQSTDGKYLLEQYFTEVLLNTLSAGNIIQTKVFPQFVDAVFFDTAHDNMLVMVNNPKDVTLYDPVTNVSIYKEIEPIDNFSSEYVYDPATGLMGTNINDYFIIIDPRQAIIKQRILVNTTSLGLYDGNLYSLNRKLDLNL